ncbi:TonB-dependent receptor [Rufibacter roseus]|uniref:TonB-dependent receptor n=1 Tax=Rufibacter roseus TaxID=1567108 RepID=A0ABW2DLS7_9BACT|nr:TonB-dependent receptor [Rufibacter roseus]
MVKQLLIICMLFFIGVTTAHSQNLMTISGTVQNKNAEGISGASVSLLNTSLGAATDSQGRFTIQQVPAGPYTLRVSALGFATRTMYVTAGNQEVVVQLEGESRQLGEVTVTAQKKEEDLQRVPFSVSTLSSKEVQEYRLWDVRELTAIVPNLFAANPGDNRNVTSIRGITTTSYDPAVTTYVDGVNQFNLDTYLPELLDIERVEVLRGPQGTLYGRNAMGGVIHIITKKPDNRVSGFAEANIGNYGQQRHSAGLRAPLVKDKLYVGVAGMFRKQNGFYTNEYNNSEFDRQQVFMGNYYLTFLPTTNWDVTLNVKHSANRNNGAFPLVFSPEEALANPFRLNQNATAQMVDNTVNASLSANYSGSGFSLASQTAYQSNHRYYDGPLDGDFSPIDGVSILNNYGADWNKVQVLTQEVRVSSPVASLSPLKWLAGVYGFYNDNPVKQGLHFGEDAEMVGAPFANFTSINYNMGEGFGAAFFGQGSYQFNPSWELTAGLRYDYEHKSQTVRGEFQMDGDEAMVTQEDTTASASFSAFSPKVSIAYRPAETSQLYATFSRGFRAGGITQLSSDPSQPPLYAYKPEFSNNYELGTKHTFLQNRLRLNVALFYTQVRDAQVPVLVMPDALVITRNVGKLNSKGAELELAATILNGLEVTYHAGYTHARYTSLTGVTEEGEVSRNGNRQIFTPEVTSMLALQYSYALGGNQNYKLVARGEWHYLGKQYFDLANQLRQNPYSLLNARAGVSARNFEVFLWGRNLSDERYIQYAYDFGAARLGNPLTYGVSARYNF